MWKCKYCKAENSDNRTICGGLCQLPRYYSELRRRWKDEHPGKTGYYSLIDTARDLGASLNVKAYESFGREREGLRIEEYPWPDPDIDYKKSNLSV